MYVEFVKLRQTWQASGWRSKHQLQLPVLLLDHTNYCFGNLIVSGMGSILKQFVMKPDSFLQSLVPL